MDRNRDDYAEGSARPVPLPPMWLIVVLLFLLNSVGFVLTVLLASGELRFR